MNRRILAALLGACALVFSLFASPVTARADGESNAVGACLASDQVWLLVVTDTDEVLANQCVGAPATGTEALTEAGLELIRDGSNFICSIGGHPEACGPFNGQFWGSYQGAPGQEYAFAMVGPDENVPAPGTIEAWCYNAAGTEGCTPPYLTIVKDGEEIAAPEGVTAVDLPVTGGATVAPEETEAAGSPSPEATPTSTATGEATPSPTATDSPAAGTGDAGDQSGGLPWGWIAAGIAVVAGAAVAIIAGRKKGGTGARGAVGGR